jgi:hypothetical protein
MQKVVLISRSTIHLSGGKPAQLTELAFDNESSILMSDLPKEYVLTFFKTADGRYSYTSQWGWQFVRELSKAS